MYRAFSLLGGVGLKHRSILSISLVGLFYVAGNGAVWFALPLLAETLVNDLLLVGLLIAVPNFVSLFFDVPLGGLSDHLGRRKLLAIGVVIMSFLGLVLHLVSSVAELVLFMVFFGIANQLIYISIRAFIMDISPSGETSKYFGFFEAFASIGFTIGPIVGGVLIADSIIPGLLSVGAFYSLMCLLALALALLLKDTIPPEGLASSMKDLIRKDKLILRELLDFKQLSSSGAVILILTFILVVTDGLIWTMEPLYTTLGLDSTTVGLVLAMFVLPFILFDIPAGMLADRFGKPKIMVVGLIMAGSFLIAFGLVREPLLLLATAFMATTGLALVRPSIDGLLTDLAEKKQKGGIVGVWDVSEDLGYVIGPIMGGLIGSYYGDIGFAFTLMGVVLLFSPLLVLFFMRANR